MMKKTFYLNFLLLFLVQGIFANVIEHETFLSNHFTDVIRSYDSRGVVRVDIKLKDRKLELPGTNFIVNSNTIGEIDKKNISSLTINVFSELKEVPAEFKTYLENKTKKLTNQTSIKFIQLEKQTNGLEAQISKGIERLTAKMGGGNNLMYVILAIPLAIIFIALFFRGQLKYATESMSNELQGLTSALQEQGIGTSVEALGGDDKRTFQAEGQSSTILEESMWEKMNEDFYIGLLTDCYWSQEDEYASFIWSKAPVEMKRKLQINEHIEADYIKHISELNPVDLGYAQNSYYLSPWKYGHISNEDLNKLIVEDKRMFGFLSPMRLEKVTLSLEEKLECIQSSAANAIKEELFLSKIENIPASAKRQLESRQEFSFSSFDEEDEILTMDVNFSIMKKFPTLGWLLKLDKEKATDILSKFQAKDLSSALYTSEKIREQLLALLPEKRRDLVVSYLEKAKPAKNKVFYTIMDSVYSELGSEFGEQDHIKEVKSA